jgi:hypothetical protein
MSVHLFGVRHHGPGSARSLLQVLESLQPDALLIEGPPDANPLIPAVGDASLVPPVALLIYAANEPKRATWYPFAKFSPEWQALRYGQAQGIHTAFMDLPQSAKAEEGEAAAEAGTPPDEQASDAGTVAPSDVEPSNVENGPASIWYDPLHTLATIAGYAESEQWWGTLIEERSGGGGGGYTPQPGVGPSGRVA